MDVKKIATGAIFVTGMFYLLAKKDVRDRYAPRVMAELSDTHSRYLGAALLGLALYMNAMPTFQVVDVKSLMPGKPAPMLPVVERMTAPVDTFRSALEEFNYDDLI